MASRTGIGLLLLAIVDASVLGLSSSSSSSSSTGRVAVSSEWHGSIESSRAEPSQLTRAIGAFSNSEQPRSGGIYSARIDRIFDKLRPQLGRIFEDIGLEPLELIDFQEKLVPLPGSLGGVVNFTNGFLHGLSGVRRTKHLTATYFDKLLLLDLNLGWKTLDCNYEYLYRCLLIKRQGDVFPRFEDVDINVVIKIDLRDYKLILNRLHFIRVGSMAFSLEGHPIDPILNKLTKVLAGMFRRTTLKIVEDRASMVLRGVFGRFNEKIPRPDRASMLRLLMED